MNSRLHNTAFALIVGAVLGVTLWSVHSREPAIVNFQPRHVINSELNKIPPSPSPLPWPPQGRPRGERVRERVNMGDTSTGINKGKTEMMIERGALSKHPAMYYKKVEK